MLRLYALKVALIEIERNVDDTAPSPKDVLIGNASVIGPLYARVIVSHETAVGDPNQLAAMLSSISDELRAAIVEQGLPHEFAAAKAKQLAQAQELIAQENAKAALVAETPVGEKIVAQPATALGAADIKTDAMIEGGKVAPLDGSQPPPPVSVPPEPTPAPIVDKTETPPVEQPPEPVPTPPVAEPTAAESPILPDGDPALAPSDRKPVIPEDQPAQAEPASNETVQAAEADAPQA